MKWVRSTVLPEDITWTNIGTTKFSGMYVSKQALAANLPGHLFSQLKGCSQHKDTSRRDSGPGCVFGYPWKTKALRRFFRRGQQGLGKHGGA